MIKRVYFMALEFLANGKPVGFMSTISYSYSIMPKPEEVQQFMIDDLSDSRQRQKGVSDFNSVRIIAFNRV